MKKIRGNIRIAELDTLTDSIIRLYQADAALAKDEYLAGLISRAQELSRQITQSLAQEKTCSGLEDADAQRDDVLRKLNTLVTGYTAIPVPEKQQAAQQISTVLGRYKGITKENYATETAHVESLLTDLGGPQLTQAASLLEGVDVYVGQLREAQDAFNRESDTFTAAGTARGTSPSSLRKPLLSLLNDSLIPYLCAMEQCGRKELSDFIAKTGAEVEKENEILSRRTKAV